MESQSVNAIIDNRTTRSSSSTPNPAGVVRRRQPPAPAKPSVGASVDTPSVTAPWRVETIEHTATARSASPYFGKRKGSASTADLKPDSITKTIGQACAIARHTRRIPAPAWPIRRDWPRSSRPDVWHPWALARRRLLRSASRSDAGRRPGFQLRRMVQTGASLFVYALRVRLQNRQAASAPCALITDDAAAQRPRHESERREDFGRRIGWRQGRAAHRAPRRARSRVPGAVRAGMRVADRAQGFGGRRRHAVSQGQFRSTTPAKAYSRFVKLMNARNCGAGGVGRV